MCVLRGGCRRCRPAHRRHHGAFNLGFASPEEKLKLLGPFQHARSMDEAHRAAIAGALRAAMVFVAEDDGEIVGVLRGRKERLQSLFVRADYHRQGVGRRLVQHFEAECLRQQSTVIRLASTLYAIPFYLALGYRRSTGVRNGWSFEGAGLRYQPMKKMMGYCSAGGPNAGFDTPRKATQPAFGPPAEQ